MPSPPFVALSEALATLFARLPDDAATRNELRRLGEALLLLSASPDGTPAGPASKPTPPLAPVLPEPETETEPEEPSLPEKPEKPDPHPPAAPALSGEELVAAGRELARTLAHGPFAASQPVRPPIPIRGDAEALAAIEANCRIKADGARWAAERQRRLSRQADFHAEIQPYDRDLIRRARELPDCFLWMCTPQAPSPADLSLFEDVGGCFDCLADAAALLRLALEQTEHQPEKFEEALDLAAEAQSGLRTSIVAIEGPVDSDQATAFAWLRDTAGSRQVFIRNHMRLDDPADPTNYPDLSTRLEQARSRLEDARSRKHRIHQLFNKLRYIAGRIAEGRTEQWDGLVATTCELIDQGIAPSHPEIRGMLLPIIDSALPREPEDVPESFRKVLVQLDRFLALNAGSSPEVTVGDEASPEIEEVRALLAGRSLLLIGGERRPKHQEALRQAFGLREVIWPDAAHHMPVSTFEPAIARPEVALVVLAIRWSSHSFGDVRHTCDQFDKPLVRLPGGYNVNQVARQILDQCGDRLRAETP